MVRLGLAVLATVLVAGCGSAERGNQTDPPVTSSISETATDGQALYDPCTAIGDDVVSAAGFDPSSRVADRFELFNKGLACIFEGERRILQVVSTDNSFDGYRQGKTNFAIDTDPIVGREAFLVRDDPADRYSCYAILRTKGGFVAVMSSVKISYVYIEEPCDGIVELATLIESTIGEGN